jgi:hypothetical protein
MISSLICAPINKDLLYNNSIPIGKGRLIMVKALQGYFRSGRFISSEPAEIPDNVEVYVMITDRELQHPISKSERQLEAFNKFVTAIRSIKDEPLTNEDFCELENNRADFGRVVAI